MGGDAALCDWRCSFFSVTLVAPDFAIPFPYAIDELLGKIVNTL